jgi:hypothetical protein
MDFKKMNDQDAIKEDLAGKLIVTFSLFTVF